MIRMRLNKIRFTLMTNEIWLNSKRIFSIRIKNLTSIETFNLD
jgi:hypothetical protein